MTPRHWLVLLVSLASGLEVIRSQVTVRGHRSDVTAIRPADAKEEAVMTDMLNIVDTKFNTLTTRISSLENAVTRLLYHSTRNMQQLQSTIKAAEKDVESLGKQVSQLKVNGDKLNIDITLLRRDMEQLRSTTTGMLGELESSVVYINNNVDKQALQLREVVEAAVLRGQQEVTAEVTAQRQQLAAHVSRVTEAVTATPPQSEFPNCTAALRRLDHRVADLAREERGRHDVLVNTTRAEIGAAVRQIRADLRDVTPPQSPAPAGPSGQEGKPYSAHVKANGPAGASSEEADYNDTYYEKEKKEVKMEVDEENHHYDTHSDLQENPDLVLLTVLMNMTESVMKAVSYVRHTGRSLEHLMANQDSIISTQLDMERKLESVQDLMLQRFTPKDFHSGAEPLELLNGGAKASRHRGAAPHQSSRSQSTSALGEGPRCVLTSDMASHWAAVARNGSQLLEVITNIANISSISLTTTTESLRNEVMKLTTFMATRPASSHPPDQTPALEELTNVTGMTLQLVNSMAGSYGYIRHIYENVQQVELVQNRSLAYTAGNRELLHELTRLTGDVSTRLANQQPDSSHSPGIPQPGGGQEATATIYKTVLQLARILPAWTKLLSEPDALFTLVGGGRLDAGRLEVYHQGRWGTVCHRDLSHREAHDICRHLGFQGGISGGRGHFGPGTGGAWALNTSCLASHKCAAVVEKPDLACSHELDATVICDHMLRLQPMHESKQKQTKAGRLEIHHRGVWLSVCGEGWSGHSARVACQQLGFSDGREMEAAALAGSDGPWLARVSCTGNETRLDACRTRGWGESCPGLVPAAVRCV